jgi:hypothetical protein
MSTLAMDARSSLLLLLLLLIVMLFLERMEQFFYNQCCRWLSIVDFTSI